MRTTSLATTYLLALALCGCTQPTPSASEINEQSAQATDETSPLSDGPVGIGQYYSSPLGTEFYVTRISREMVDPGFDKPEEPGVCINVYIKNKEPELLHINPVDFTLSYPDKTRQDTTLHIPKDSARLDVVDLLNGDEVVGTVCYPDNGQVGEYMAIYKPTFSNEPPLRWVGTLNE